MALNARTRLGPYEITGQIGAGGMGEVYVAKDTRLGRKVAIKVLPAGLGANTDRRLRFEREARVISSLRHPNVCSLFDVGSQDDTDYLVMEFLEGEPLDRRLARGPLPLDEALEIGAEIAEGLDAAHRAGLVHRDLKPGNVMLTPHGVKILDFGLAKAVAPVGTGEDGSVAATRTRPISSEGLIAGTLQYMSPEQLEGRPVDARSDIFALGTVLYEMVTGERPFTGGSQASLIGAILRDKPPAPSSRRDVSPAPLDRLIQRCLEKKPERRWQSARDVSGELEWIRTEAPAGREAAAASTQRPRLAWAVAAVAVIGATAAVVWSTMARRDQARPEPVVFEVVAPPDHDLRPEMALRPDGRQIAYLLADLTGVSQVWLRDLDVLESRAVAGTEGATDMFYSPDGEHLGFFARGELHRIELATGRVARLASAPDARGGSWGARGDIIYSSESVIWRIADTGGQPSQATELDKIRLEDLHAWPQFMPDGVHFLFQADDADDEYSGLALQALGSTTPVHVRDAFPMNAHFAGGPGLLLYLDASSVKSGVPRAAQFNATLVLAPFSPLTGEITGAPVVVAGPTWASPPHRKAVAMSSRGDLALQPRNADPTLNVAIYDRNGREVDRLTGAGSRVLGISADGNRLVLEQSTGAERFYAVRTRGGTTSRVTSDPRIGSAAFLSEDGSTLVYDLFTGPPRLVARSLDDDKEIEIPISLEQWSLLDVSAHGDTLVLISRSDRRSAPDERGRLALAPIDGTSDPRVVAELPLTGWNSAGFATASLSPDGRWVAYSTYAAGDVQRVWLYSTANGARRFEVSEGGGRSPFWKGDSSTLYFVDRTGSLVAVDMADQAGPSLPRHLFRLGPATRGGGFTCVAVDQDRFGCPDYSTISQIIEVRLNWLDSLPGLR